MRVIKRQSAIILPMVSERANITKVATAFGRKLSYQGFFRDLKGEKKRQTIKSTLHSWACDIQSVYCISNSIFEANIRFKRKQFNFMDNTIIMVASGMKRPKKDFNRFNELNRYLNYGLLGLGTQLYNKGYKVKIFQGDYKKISEVIDEIESNNIQIKKLNYPICVSIPSFFSIDWANEFIQNIHEINNDAKIVLGGRWVIDNNIEWLKLKMPSVNSFVCGYGEHTIEQYISGEFKESIAEEKTRTFTDFNYTLLHNFKEYQPCVEISRGCGRGCEFCLEGKIKSIPSKKANQVIKEAVNTIKIYNTDTLNFYFQASIFNPSIKWSQEFLGLYRKNKLKFNWRFETRVDSLNPRVLPILANSGLKVIDLGLESASSIQLQNMGKTSNVEQYLNKAEILIREAYENNIWIKINIILYPGETNKTLKETSDWLNKNKEYIKGVSVNPLILYRNGDFTESYVSQIEKIINRKIDVNELERDGFMFINLSDVIDIEYSQKLSLDISRAHMNINDYFDLKSISYYPRSIKFEDLLEIVNSEASDLNNLPFNIEK